MGRKVDPRRISELLDRELTYKEIADRLGVSRFTVYWWAKKLGKQRGRGGRWRWLGRREKVKKAMYELLARRGPLDINEIVREIGTSRRLVYEILRENDEEFVTFKFTVGRRGSQKFGSFSLFDGMAGRRFVALRGDPRIVDFMASHISGDMTMAKAKALHRRLKEFFDEATVTKIIAEAGYPRTSRRGLQ